MMNFNDALNVKMDEIERPPLLPLGTYRWMVEKVPSFDTIADGRFDVVDFQLKCMGAEEDVDADDIKAYGDITNARMRHRFMFNKEDEANFKRTLFNLKRFIGEHLQVDVEGVSLKEALSNTLNQSCLGTVGWRPDKNDPEIMYAEIKQTAPLA